MAEAGQSAGTPPRAGAAMLAEAAVSLLTARLILALLPFRWAMRSLTTPSHPIADGDPRRAFVRQRVRDAVFRIWRRFPTTNTCFHRALAAHWMLARRGIATQLYYGAATRGDRGLEGHVWLKDGDAWVVGHDGAVDLPVLARFSETDRM